MKKELKYWPDCIYLPQNVDKLRKLRGKQMSKKCYECDKLIGIDSKEYCAYDMKVRYADNTSSMRRNKMSTKQVIVSRTKYPDDKGGTFKLRTGKLIAQACHASLKVFFDRAWHLWFFSIVRLTPAMFRWSIGMFTKISVYVESEEELLEIYKKAKEANIPCSLVKDSGLTEFHGIPTYTAVAIGPDYSNKIDLITGGLPLL
jgi:PTH2 family peptidyl-tRNA hydrolase